MRLSRYFATTLREDPSEAEVVSHRLMLRAGMICKLAAGIYDYLPLGLRVLRKIEGIVREEMNRAGAIEVLLPAVQPSELWLESGRWNQYGPELLRLTDRHKREFCVGPTHEEVVTDLVRRIVKSYRDLPVNLYQIQTKFRDEVRPRFGLMRGREFIMKDAYSFDVDEAGAEESYRKMFEAYGRIFTRCGLAFRAVEAETGPIGGSFSHEFMVLADSGEDEIIFCGACEYAANSERAEIGDDPVAPSGRAAGSPSLDPVPALSKVATPGRKSVEEVSVFLGVGPERLVKTMICRTSAGTVAALVRGDHELNEAKLKRALGADWVELADPETIERETGAETGFVGPVGLKLPILADRAVQRIEDGVTGANEKDTHYVHVSPSRDFPPVRWLDLRKARAGDGCPRCRKGLLGSRRGIEVGHVFKLGAKYTDAMRAVCLHEDGAAHPMIMGCYGIGVSRTMAAAIEQNHDQDGIRWPVPLAPFQVVVLPVNTNDAAVVEKGEQVYRGLAERGIEVLLDDRPERPGVKFKDADLVGFPLAVVVGSKGLKEGRLEVKIRRTGERVYASADEIVSRTAAVLAEEAARGG